MLAVVLPHVDHLHSDFSRPEGGLHDGLLLPDEGHHDPVVGGVRIHVEQLDAGDRLDGPADGGVDLGVAAVGKIGNAFNDGLHGGSLQKGRRA
jgi:hypothetical protein